MQRDALLARGVWPLLILLAAAAAEAADLPSEVSAALGGGVGEQVGEACLTALAEREGRSRAEVLAELSSASSSAVAACDLAVATASPVAIYVQSLNGWLEKAGPGYQLLISFVVIGIGSACAWDGPAIWRALFTILAAATAAGVTHHEAALWGISPNLISEIVLMAQVAAAAALAVHVGFEASQVLFGVALGLIGAYGAGDWARSFEHAAPGLCLLWYELGAVAGFLLYTVWRKAVLSTLAPLFGAFLITTACGILLSWTCALVADQVSSEPFSSPLLPRTDEPWVIAAGQMLGKAGIFALPVHCAAAMFATLVHGLADIRWLSVACLVSTILVAAASAPSGFVCQAWPEKLQAHGVTCPDWLQEVSDWGWPVAGSLTWALAAALSAWRQLGLLEAWEANNFWRSEISTMYNSVDRPDGRYARQVMSAEESPPMQQHAFQTKLPTGYGNNASQDSRHFPYRPAQQQEEPGALESFVHRMNTWWSEANAPAQPSGYTRY